MPFIDPYHSGFSSNVPFKAVVHLYSDLAKSHLLPLFSLRVGGGEINWTSSKGSSLSIREFSYIPNLGMSERYFRLQ